jgi:hypothetical protein
MKLRTAPYIISVFALLAAQACALDPDGDTAGASDTTASATDGVTAADRAQTFGPCFVTAYRPTNARRTGASAPEPVGYGLASCNAPWGGGKTLVTCLQRRHADGTWVNADCESGPFAYDLTSGDDEQYEVVSDYGAPAANRIYRTRVTLRGGDGSIIGRVYSPVADLNL